MMLNTNQLIVLQKQKVIAEITRQTILQNLKDGLITVDDLILNKHLNHALFSGYT